MYHYNENYYVNNNTLHGILNLQWPKNSLLYHVLQQADTCIKFDIAYHHGTIYKTRQYGLYDRR
jgi:hypothetical protein